MRRYVLNGTGIRITIETDLCDEHFAALNFTEEKAIDCFIGDTQYNVSMWFNVNDVKLTDF